LPSALRPVFFFFPSLVRLFILASSPDPPSSCFRCPLPRVCRTSPFFLPPPPFVSQDCSRSVQKEYQPALSAVSPFLFFSKRERYSSLFRPPLRRFFLAFRDQREILALQPTRFQLFFPRTLTVLFRRYIAYDLSFNNFLPAGDPFGCILLHFRKVLLYRPLLTL